MGYCLLGLSVFSLEELHFWFGSGNLVYKVNGATSIIVTFFPVRFLDCLINFDKFLTFTSLNVHMIKVAKNKPAFTKPCDSDY